MKTTLDKAAQVAREFVKQPKFGLTFMRYVDCFVVEGADYRLRVAPDPNKDWPVSSPTDYKLEYTLSRSWFGQRAEPSRFVGMFSTTGLEDTLYIKQDTDIRNDLIKLYPNPTRTDEFRAFACGGYVQPFRDCRIGWEFNTFQRTWSIYGDISGVRARMDWSGALNADERRQYLVDALACVEAELDVARNNAALLRRPFNILSATPEDNVVRAF